MGIEGIDSVGDNLGDTRSFYYGPHRGFQSGASFKESR